jgi:hypothetical protein
MRYLEGAGYYIGGVFNFSDVAQKVFIDSKAVNEKSRIEHMFGIKAGLADGKISIDMPVRSISIFKVS